MKRSARLLTLLALVSLVAPGILAPGQTALASQPRPASGADFVHPDADFYVSIDPSIQSEQHATYARIFTSLLSTPEAAELWRLYGRWLVGLDLPLDEVARDAGGWLGNDLFVASSGRLDWRWLQGSQIDINCLEQGVLAGAAIRDMAGFQSFLTTWSNRLRAQGAPTRTERVGATEVVWAGRSPEPGGGIYLAVARGYLLASNSRTSLVEALERRADRTLSSSSRYQTAVRDLPDGRTGLLYFNVPAETFAGALPAGRTTVAPTWGAASLRLAGEGVRLDLVGAPGQASTAAERALLAKPSSALRSPSVAPRASNLFFAWDNMKLLWDVIAENAWSSRAEYESQTRYERGGITYDLDVDVFSWMTGEVALFVAPSSQPVEMVGNVGGGLLIEAKDVALAREKFEKLLTLMELEAGPRTLASTEEIAGVPFRKVGDASFSFYAAVVDDWVVVTTDAGLAEQVVAGVRGGQGLASNPEFVAVRSTFPPRSQTIMYAHLAELAEMLSPAWTGRGGPPPEVDQYLRMVRGVGMSTDWSSERSVGTYYAHVVVPPTFRPPTNLMSADDLRTSVSALVDLSHSGLPGETGFGDPPAATAFAQFFRQQGNGFVSYIHPGQRVGSEPRDERRLPRFDSSDPIVEPNRSLLVRVGSVGPYSEQEIKAYQDYVRCGGVLVLLSDQKAPGEADDLAAAFGLRVAGTLGGDATLTGFGSQAAFADAPPLPMPGGTGLAASDDYTRRIGLASEGTFLDLNGNGVRDVDEPVAPPVLAVRAYGHGTVAFLGTTSVMERPDHPVFAQLLRYLLPEARWARLTTRDRFEPDDSAAAAKPITLGETQEGRSLHAGDNDWVSFSLNAGERVTMSTASTCDTYLYLYSPDATTVLAEDDDSGQGSNASVSYTAVESGTYYARVRHFSESSGTCDSYRLVTSMER